VIVKALPAEYKISDDVYKFTIYASSTVDVVGLQVAVVARFVPANNFKPTLTYQIARSETPKVHARPKGRRISWPRDACAASRSAVL